MTSSRSGRPGKLRVALSKGWSSLGLRHLAVVGGVLVLAGTAVIVARGDASEEVAKDARALTWAESVATAASTLRGEARESLVISQAATRDVFDEEAVANSVQRIRDASSELDGRAAVLAPLARSSGIEGVVADVVAHTESLATALDSGNVDDALAIAESELGPAFEALSERTTAVSRARADHITRVSAEVGNVTTAARFVAALLIPVLAVYLIYRAMRRSQKVSMLRSELRWERDLRRKKDAFIAAASHHIRTPLASVVGFSELLRARSRDFNAGVRHEVTELLALEAKETANVADDLLAAARSDLGQMEMSEDEIEVRDVIDSVASDWVATQRMRLTITGAAVVLGDERWLTHAIRNLLRNAASFGGQQISVRVRTVMKRVIIEIADNGEAIPAHERDRIFELYYSYRQVDGLAPSLGLGLSVARRIARAMGGELEYRRLDGENIFELVLQDAGTESARVAIPARTFDPTEGAPDIESITGVIEAGGPPFVYQPVVHFGSTSESGHRVVGYEAVAHFGSQAPAQWFEAASAVDKQLDLELVCVRKAIRQFDPPQKDAFLAVNVSDLALHTSRLRDAIEGIDPTRLVLELSEASSIKSYEETGRVVDALAVRGIRLAVDDVGSGDVDLWHLTRIGAHMVKIDVSLVRELRDSLRSRGLIRAIAAMAEELGTVAIAEGIETQEELAVLKDLGIRFGQGYLFGHPGDHFGKSEEVDGPEAYRVS